MKPQKEFNFTLYQFKKGMEGLAGTSIPQGNNTNVNSTTSAPGSGTPITGKPKHISEIPIGVRPAYLQKINLVQGDVYKYYIYFETSNTGVWAKKTGTTGVDDWPDGHIVEGIYYLDTPKKISAQIELKSLTWIIVGEDEELNEIEPGTKKITKGEARITVHNDYITIGYPDSYIEITENSIDLHSTTIKANGTEIGE